MVLCPRIGAPCYFLFWMKESMILISERDSGRESYRYGLQKRKFGMRLRVLQNMWWRTSNISLGLGYRSKRIKSLCWSQCLFQRLSSGCVHTHIHTHTWVFEEWDHTFFLHSTNSLENKSSLNERSQFKLATNLLCDTGQVFWACYSFVKQDMIPTTLVTSAARIED